MNYRLYNVTLGSALLVSLYFSLDTVMYLIITILLLEGISGILLSVLLADFPIKILNDAPPKEFRKKNTSNPFFLISSDRAWRFLVAAILIVSFIFFSKYLWFMPWFMGFAILGAGVSGVCPMLLAIRMTGLK